MVQVGLVSLGADKDAPPRARQEVSERSRSLGYSLPVSLSTQSLFRAPSAPHLSSRPSVAE